MTTTSYTADLPPASELLGGNTFTDAPPGTPFTLTYSFETSAPTSGTWAGDPTWIPFTSFEQSVVRQTMAAIAAVCNVTFTEESGSAQLNYGNSTVGG